MSQDSEKLIFLKVLVFEGPRVRVAESLHAALSVRTDHSLVFSLVNKLGLESVRSKRHLSVQNEKTGFYKKL